MSVNWKYIFAIFVMIFISGCTSNNAQQQTQAQANKTYVDQRDPFEETNRALWDFNWNVLDKHILRPMAVGYSKLPQPAQSGVKNFVTNLEEPGYAINNLLQGDFGQSGSSVGRFVINSTIGILGLFDVASHLGLERQKESFGETLAVANVGNGPFIMVPGYGPTTVRDASGDFVDGQIFPLYLLTFPQAVLKLGLKAVYTRAELMQQESMIYNSTDSYIFVKEAYYQNQHFKIHDGNPPVKEEETLDEDILDELDEF